MPPATSVLGEGTNDLSLKFTKKSSSGDGRLEDEPVPWFECRVVDKADPGDHVVYYGEVIGGDATEAAATTIAATGMSYAG